MRFGLGNLFGKSRRPPAPVPLPVPSAASPSPSSGPAEGFAPAAPTGFHSQQMVFQIGAGELPNVLQFLATAGKTGKLEVDVRRMLEPNGVIYLREGTPYYARYGQHFGTEAVARLTRARRSQAVFFYDVTANDSNIAIPTPSFLVEVARRADELASRSAPSEEEAETEPFLLGKVPENPGGDAAAAEKPRALGMRPAAPEVRRPGIGLGNMLKVGAILLILVGSVVTGYLVFLRIEARERERTAEFATLEREAATVRVERQRKLRALQLVQEAELAFADKDYAAAGQRVAECLSLDPNHPGAVALHARVEQALAADEAATLRADAEARRSRLAGLDRGNGFGERIDRVDLAVRASEALFGTGEYLTAAQRYREAVALADDVLRDAGMRRRALAMREYASTALAEAEAPELPRPEGADWQEAQAEHWAGDALFKDGRFAAAALAWERAGDGYCLSSDRARFMRRSERIRGRVEGMLGKLDSDVLPRVGGREWGTIQKQIEEAHRLGDTGDWSGSAAAWSRVEAALAPLVDRAWAHVNAERYAQFATQTREALAARRWDEAESLSRAALGLSGYAVDEGAKASLRAACVGRGVAAVEAAHDSADWVRARAEAQAVLALDPGCTRAKELLVEAEGRLQPRLQIGALRAGRPVQGAEIRVDDALQPERTPATLRLEMNKDYALAVSLAPEGETYFETVRQTYSVRHPGEQALTVEIREIGAPSVGVVWTVPGLDLAMAAVAAGTFRMGSELRREEKPIRDVRVTRAFWMARTELTNWQYQVFVRQAAYDGRADSNTSYLRHWGRSTELPPALAAHPVCFVSWRNAEAFCAWLTARERRNGRLPDGYAYRLPTEAEWEYACRAGATAEVTGELAEHAWFMHNCNSTQPVARYPANAWGLHDMLGNVWELCHDWYGPYLEDQIVDPAGPDKGVLRVMRGGSWANAADLCRPANRSSIAATDTKPNVGFRIVLAPPGP